jgi:hypothetical protein
LRKAFEVALQLSGIKVKNPIAAGTMFPTVAFSVSAAFLLAHPLGAASGLSIHLAATGPLGATLLHPLADSARLSPTESLAATVAATSDLGVPLAGAPARYLAGIAAMQQPQGRKRGQPPKNPAELSNNPRSKQQQEYQHGLANETGEAEPLKRNNYVAHCRTR